jgi:hypothetical protein
MMINEYTIHNCVASGIKLILIFSINGSLLLTSCQEDTNEELKQELSVAKAKLALANAKSDNNLITKIVRDNQYYTFYFELGGPLSISTQRIRNIEYDSSNWLATFQFQDGSNQSVNFIGELKFNESEIILDPHLTSPLSAFAGLNTPVKGKFKVIVKGKHSSGITIEKSFDFFGSNHNLPILGLYENYNNQVEFVFMNENNQIRCSKTISIPVGPITNKPDLDFRVLKNQLTSEYHGLFVVFNYKIGFDQMGDIRWYFKGEGASFYCKLRNGNFITNNANNLSFYEVTMLGQRVKKYDVPNALHHEIVEMPNGNFLVASHSPPGAPYEDVVVEINNHNYWTESFQPFLLTPVDANGDEIEVFNTDFWNYGQHAIQKTSRGNILMYDNGDYRGYYDDLNSPQNSYTRLVEYKINEQSKTVQLVWQFDNNKTVFTKYTGYVQELPETNSRLAAYMWVTENTPKIQEISASDQVVFEATLKPNNAVYYRTYKVDLYSGID